jgi:hypothetical protein
MNNTTDLIEIEVLLIGDWIQKGSGNLYSFTPDRMALSDERLFKELYISHPPDKERRAYRYALTIEGDYCGILVDDQEFVITSITKNADGSASMEWADKAGEVFLTFDHAAD